MGEYYLAVDIGASSGRHILGHIEDGKLILEEVHRFENKMEMRSGELCWDLDSLFQEIKVGLGKCKKIGKIPVSVGIDTWGVDFVLLDEKDQVVGNTVCYRDKRTQGMDEAVYALIPEAELYQRTGIQKLIFNTIYQLMAVKQKKPEHLSQAKTLLMIPDYLHFLLSGVKGTEYTNSTTTQLVSPLTKDWDRELIELLGFPQEIFAPLIQPGSCLGHLTEEVQQEVGFNCLVVVPATHDTASAVIAVPSTQENSVYISSGTWSLLGVERTEADCSPASKQHNFTNEGGYDYRFRYLKNIMGLWMIQSLQRELGNFYSFPELCEKAARASIDSIVDCNDQRFLAPDSMITEVIGYCLETKQQVPEGAGELAAVIYNSLARCYAKTIQELEQITNRTFQQIHVVGGGANAEYLNQLTARITGRTVIAGPIEATAAGNLLVQMLRGNEFKDLAAARACLINSQDIRTFSS